MADLRIPKSGILYVKETLEGKGSQQIVSEGEDHQIYTHSLFIEISQ